MSCLYAWWMQITQSRRSCTQAQQSMYRSDLFAFTSRCSAVAAELLISRQAPCNKTLPTWRTNAMFIVWDSYLIFPFRFYPPLQVFRSSTYMVRGVWSSDMSIQYGSNILLPPNCFEIPAMSLPPWHSTPRRYLRLTRMWHWTKDVKSTYHLIRPFCCTLGLTVRLPEWHLPLELPSLTKAY